MSYPPGCTCPQTCDCQDPKDEPGQEDEVAFGSESCPIHNIYPWPNPDCPLHGNMGAMEFCQAIATAEKLAQKIQQAAADQFKLALA